MAEGKIYEAINNVMSDIGAVGKNGTNTSQKYKFRGIDAVMNALNPALIKNKVFVAPEILEQSREERANKNGGLNIYSILKIKFTFYTMDGSSVEVVTIGEGMDSGDKASNKSMSVAFKYACFQLFCIPTEELLEESDEESPEVLPKEPARITDIQKKEIEGYLNDGLLNAKAICERYGLSSCTELNVDQYEVVRKSALKAQQILKEKANGNQSKAS